MVTRVYIIALFGLYGDQLGEGRGVVVLVVLMPRLVTRCYMYRVLF